MTERGVFDDEFDALANELEGVMVDPLIKWVRDHAQAATADTDMLVEGDRMKYARKTIRELNTKWPYLGQLVRVSGRVNVPSGDKWSSVAIVDHPLVSRGFKAIETIESSPIDEEPLATVRIYYEFETNLTDDEDRHKVIAFAAPDMIDDIQLPYPSDELRVRRFLYDYPNDVSYINELAEVGCADQALMELGDYYFEIDIESNQHDIEAVKDAMAFLRQRANLEKYANYHLKFTRDVIVIDANGDGHPRLLKGEHSGMASIRDILLHPILGDTQDVSVGKQCLVPYVEAVIFHPTDRERDYHLLIPCHSLIGVQSARYLSAS